MLFISVLVVAVNWKRPLFYICFLPVVWPNFQIMLNSFFSFISQSLLTFNSSFLFKNHFLLVFFGHIFLSCYWFVKFIPGLIFIKLFSQLFNFLNIHLLFQLLSVHLLIEKDSLLVRKICLSSQLAINENFLNLLHPVCQKNTFPQNHLK